ncbi:hypothetical protein 1 [Changjiang tombus-like virus 22]|uniref:hypothetical protein 1 n=1 Tax=Changjiang tombus-like virus 22 TaxID=1922816 RepID=UPI00090C582F|nr:hypothetical protein 1 [Changjiang tombus-like virus 22]APG76277.1 hypothetical protein 1 [Changjiang tombus-like virus 22]
MERGDCDLIVPELTADDNSINRPAVGAAFGSFDYGEFSLFSLGLRSASRLARHGAVLDERVGEAGSVAGSGDLVGDSDYHYEVNSPGWVDLSPEREEQSGLDPSVPPPAEWEWVDPMSDGPDGYSRLPNGEIVWNGAENYAALMARDLNHEMHALCGNRPGAPERVRGRGPPLRKNRPRVADRRPAVRLPPLTREGRAAVDLGFDVDDLDQDAFEFGDVGGRVGVVERGAVIIDPPRAPARAFVFGDLGEPVEVEEGGVVFVNPPRCEAPALPVEPIAAKGPEPEVPICLPLPEEILESTDLAAVQGPPLAWDVSRLVKPAFLVPEPPDNKGKPRDLSWDERVMREQKLSALGTRGSSHTAYFLGNQTLSMREIYKRKHNRRWWLWVYLLTCYLLCSFVFGFSIWLESLWGMVLVSAVVVSAFCLFIWHWYSVMWGIVTYMVVLEDVPDRETEHRRLADSEQPDIRTHPLAKGAIERPVKERRARVSRVEKNFWGGEFKPCRDRTLPVSQQLLDDCMSPRIVPQSIMGDDAAVAERVGRYLATCSHVNTANSDQLIQNTGEIARLLIAERFNNWSVHRGQGGFLPGAS